ncbi:hypothetical protein HF086_002580 [Spodoptera exigua]|uniref:F-box domain-containing protein n=1 Tax=Spodoptera exigua TaxID=7107 RepID=A0A922SFX9_SPOEX|nr:hypothetical protein HF086_002580 [Spodoptera exigua]
MDLLGLPVVMIENIFSYLSYDEIAKNRLVSRAFNEISMRMLNRGFMMIERRHAMALKSVKAQLPRRESERRYHHLSRHCDILTSIETRISMLNMTYSKFIDNGLCCFIPGKVIDEIRRVLTIVETSTTPPRAHEVLQELRDISSMAIEHFDDKISPAFRKRLQQGVVQPTPRPSHAVLAPLAIRQEMIHLRQRSILNAKLSLYLASQYKKFHKRLPCKVFDQARTCVPASAGGEPATSAQPLRHFSSQIKLDLSVLPIGTSKRNNKLLPNMKPRKPLIKLPSLSEDDAEPPPKLPKIDESRFNPTPSTSVDRQSPKTKSQTTIAKIRGIANEIRYLTNLPKAYEAKLKRPLALTGELNVPEIKKQKLD